MPIKVVDLKAMAAETESCRRQVLMNGPRFHTWLHIYFEPGERDEMHCHNADESFAVIEGECTMYFPDGTKEVMRPGMVALIPGGQFYQLENTGSGRMVLMGNRGLSTEASATIDHATRQDVHDRSATLPTGTRILV